MNPFTENIYIILFVIALLSVILTTFVLVISKIKSTSISITNSFIYKYLKLLLISTTVHSVGYVLNWIVKEDGKAAYGEFFCSLQSIVLVFTCQNQEVWVCCITMICYKGVVRRKYYSSSEHKPLFIISLLLGLLMPSIIVIIYLLCGATGYFGLYCWIDEELNQGYIIGLYICKYLLIAFNLIVSFILVIYVSKVDSSNEENKQIRLFCFKTLVIPIIEVVMNITTLILRLTSCPKPNSIISSLQGIIYPLYIGWYAEIYQGYCNKTTSDNYYKMSDPQTEIGLIDRNNPKTTSTSNETTVQLITEENTSLSLNNSLDYYA